MATTRPLSHHHYYQIAPSIIYSKFLSRSTDSVLNNTLKDLSQQKDKQVSKTSKLKSSPMALTNCDAKPLQSIGNSTSLLRRRFSLFRTKRPQQSNENANVQALQQIIDQLRHDLQLKNDELASVKKQFENKNCTILQTSNESIEQAMQLQTMLNSKLEEMLTENDLLKKSVQELESYAEQHRSKKESISFRSFIIVCSYSLAILTKPIAQ